MASALARPPMSLRSSSAFTGARISQARVLPAAGLSRRPAVAPQALLGGLFGGSKESSSGAATPYYICVDCGWIYPDDFKKAPGSFRCPACNSPKSRFKVYKGKVGGRPNNTGAAMKKRFAEKQW